MRFCCRSAKGCIEMHIDARSSREGGLGALMGEERYEVDVRMAAVAVDEVMMLL